MVHWLEKKSGKSKIRPKKIRKPKPKPPARFIGATVLDEMWDYIGITNENSSIDTSKGGK